MFRWVYAFFFALTGVLLFGMGFKSLKDHDFKPRQNDLTLLFLFLTLTVVGTTLNFWASELVSALSIFIYVIVFEGAGAIFLVFVANGGHLKKSFKLSAVFIVLLFVGNFLFVMASKNRENHETVDIVREVLINITTGTETTEEWNRTVLLEYGSPNAVNNILGREPVATKVLFHSDILEVHCYDFCSRPIFWT